MTTTNASGGEPAAPDRDVLAVEPVQPEVIAVAYNDAQAILDDWLTFAVDQGDKGLYNTVQHLSTRNLQLATAATTQSEALIALKSFAVQIVEQRDRALTELTELDAGLKDIWMTKHPKLTPVYDEVMQAHNAAFWESLPYDLANTLGDDWSHMDTDMLYSLLTVEEEVVDEDGFEYGFTPDQLLSFRRKLLAMVREVQP